LAGAPANAQSVAATPEVSHYTVTLKGVVSFKDLAASEANRRALQTPHTLNLIEKPLHRLPNGGLTSQPSQDMLNQMPVLAHPNVRVFPAFSSVKGFVGITADDNDKLNGGDIEPPDQGLAVNTNVAAEINNDITQFFNATTGASMAGPVANSKFFLTGADSLTDTQAFYDPTTKRWFLDTLDYTSTKNDFAIAVSQTSNPLGKYWIYDIDDATSKLSGCGGMDCFPDYPKAGYDAHALFVTADLFNNVTNTFVESAIYVFPKSLLEAGKGFTYDRFDDPADFVVQPSVPAPSEPFSTADNGSEFLMSAPGSSSVAVIAIYNTADIVTSPSSLKSFRTTVKSQNYGTGTVPSTQPNVIGPYCKSVGVTSAPKLDGGYSAFQATVQKASGYLSAALAFGAKDGTSLSRDVIAWFEVKPTLTTTSLSASIVHQGALVPPNGYSIAYPAFALAKSGAGAMGMSITNKSQAVAGGYPSTAFDQFTGTGFTGSIGIVGKGATSDDGFTGCAMPGPGQVGRWGDYAAATVDTATGYFYTANEMIPNPTKYPRGPAANWGTFIIQLH
jgi:hypothetical protein